MSRFDEQVGGTSAAPLVGDKAGLKAEVARAAASSSARGSSSKARARFNRWIKLARRAHLYAGLFMVPWVFLYGISAMLLNHPSAFSGQREVAFRVEGSDGPKGSPSPAIEASGLAERVVEALNAPRSVGSKGDQPPADAAQPPRPTYRLVEPAEARFARDLSATLKGEGKEYNVRVDLATGEAVARPADRKPQARPAPFASKSGVKLDPSPFDAVLKAIPPALGETGEVEGASKLESSSRVAPDLSFLMEGDDGKTWRVTYNALTGAVSGREVGEAAGPTLRRELILLHVAHGFPGEVNARWAWAVFVDLMFVSMVGWGLTGLLMWWQMKNVRLVGLVVLALSAVAATLVAWGMHARFVAEGVS